MARKSVTTTLRQGVSRVIRGAEKKGYRFSEEFKSQIKEMNWRQLKELKKNNYQKLYSQATAERDGRIISGAEERALRRSEAGRKAARTRREKRDRKRAEEDAIKKCFSAGSTIYKNLDDIIRQYYGLPGDSILQELITRQLDTYGYDKFIASLYFAQGTDIAEQATELAKCGSDDIREGLHIPPYNALIAIITQCKQSLEELIRQSAAGETMEEVYENGN